MSIINGMHKDLNESEQVQPVLSDLPVKKTKQQGLLLSAIVFLVACAIILLSLIFFTGKNESMAQVSNSDHVTSVPNKASQILEPENQLNETAFLHNENATNHASSTSSPTSSTTSKASKAVINKGKSTTKEVAVKRLTKPIAAARTPDKKTTQHKKKNTTKQPPIKAKEIASGHLYIEPAQLTDNQLANLYLKEASKAQLQGNSELTAEKWHKALNVKPDLNEVRKSLATYHYSQGELSRATRLLKKGALISPDYSDFNLMLSRIALKQDDPQKAFLYLEQNPPQVEGHLDYYVSHAILAQKFERYERSEMLYNSLLTQRPKNGRWLMSLAIAQDKQAKTSAAIVSYQKALKQTDLSIKAKDYINKRLVFLSKE